MKFSIIIPAYNCGEVIRNCVNSVLMQSHENFELLIIDDGSKDDTPRVCDELASSDPRILITHQKNMGTSGARNTGLKQAQGDYVAFLDNDDIWLHNGVLASLDNVCRKTNSDIICFKTTDSWIDGTDHSRGHGSPAPTLSGEYYSDIHTLTKTSRFTPAVWSKIVKTDLIRSQTIRFPENARNEDIDFSCKLLRYANSINYIDDTFYAWTRGSSSSQSSGHITARIADDLEKIIVDNAKYALTQETKRRTSIEEFLSFPYAVWLTYTNAYSRNEFTQRWSRMKEYAYLLEANGDQRADRVRKMNKIAGISLTCFIARMLGAINRHEAFRRR